MKTTASYATLWVVLLAICARMLAACGPEAPAPTQVALAPAGNAKLLATVDISPTPDAAQWQATLRAQPPTETPLPATPEPTATAYIGVFLGEAGSIDDSSALAAIQQLQAQRDAATPVPDAGNRCPRQPDEAFGTFWRADALAGQIGCPADAPTPYNGVSQLYERGVIYRTPDGELWAITPRGEGGGQFWYAAQPPDVPLEDVSAPPGLRPPGQRFAAFWQSNIDVRDRLGFAQTDVVGTSFTVQHFQNGTLVLDNSAGQVWLLVGTGDTGPAAGPY